MVKNKPTSLTKKDVKQSKMRALPDNVARPKSLAKPLIDMKVAPGFDPIPPLR